jgi:hypothetical protein
VYANNSTAFLDEKTLKAHGITIKSEEKTSLEIFSDDDTLYNSFFELEISTGSFEEPSWKNNTRIKINYYKPPCQMTQEEINEIAYLISPLSLKA